MREFNTEELEALRHMTSSVDGGYIDNEYNNRVSVKDVLRWFAPICSDMTASQIRNALSKYPKPARGDYHIAELIKSLY